MGLDPKWRARDPFFNKQKKVIFHELPRTNKLKLSISFGDYDCFEPMGFAQVRFSAFFLSFLFKACRRVAHAHDADRKSAMPHLHLSTDLPLPSRAAMLVIQMPKYRVEKHPVPIPRPMFQPEKKTQVFRTTCRRAATSPAAHRYGRQ